MERAGDVRTYQPSDRSAVRQLSCDTADQGDSVDRFFSDGETVADVLVRYYTDYEPQSLWVAECEGLVVGYLTGCLDTGRSTKVVRRKIMPKAVATAIARGALWRGETWRLLAAFAGTVCLGGFPPAIDLERYPAHFHINIRHGFRGRKLGQQLVESFRQQADRAGVCGIHVVARGDNAGGLAFFEAMGFHLLREQPLVLPQGRRFGRTSTVVYGWEKEG